ncbi:MAG: Hsp20/alpha crystallin family protein [Chromatiales bacterium]|jgi:HSP20 family protein
MFESMSNFEGSLFDDFRRLEREMDQLFGSVPWSGGIRAAARGSYPPVNVGVTPQQIDVYLFAPGVEPKQLEITLHQNLLTVKGERRPMREEGAQYYRRERFDGAFHRAVNLPDDADPDRVEANYQDGVLHIAVQRRESAKPRQIEVK